MDTNNRTEVKEVTVAGLYLFTSDMLCATRYEYLMRYAHYYQSKRVINIVKTKIGYDLIFSSFTEVISVSGKDKLYRYCQ